ncbi:hypothetical protein PV10_02144 [Exophiala mesophila]|uniref:Uncharacterized protein n=1 Tax=Exophiala mesophila TaxID=212818 RepID=A0A0D1Y1E4_EXOME|nr:uncharacterized protein PV10_02144 [Exophiala mesophila]KIV94371.1 hypothetical protein PV10_02144 [Exophiala mesophila]
MSSPNTTHVSGLAEVPISTPSSDRSDCTLQGEVTTAVTMDAGKINQPMSTAPRSEPSSSPAPVPKTSRHSWPGFTHSDLMRKAKQSNTPWGYHARSRDVLWEMRSTYNTRRPELPKGIAHYTAEALQFYTSVLNKTKAEHKDKIQGTKKSPTTTDDNTRHQMGSVQNGNALGSTGSTPPATPVTRKRPAADDLDGSEDASPFKKRASPSIHNQTVPAAHSMNSGRRRKVIIDSDDEVETSISQETPSKKSVAQEAHPPSKTVTPEPYAPSIEDVGRSQPLLLPPFPILAALTSDAAASLTHIKKRRRVGSPSNNSLWKSIDSCQGDPDTEEPAAKKARDYRHVRPESNKENRDQPKKERLMAQNKAKNMKTLPGKPLYETKTVTSKKPKTFQIARDDDHDGAGEVEPENSSESKTIKAFTAKYRTRSVTSATAISKQAMKHTDAPFSKASSSKTHGAVEEVGSSTSHSGTQTASAALASHKGKVVKPTKKTTDPTTFKADKVNANAPANENPKLARGVAVRSGSNTSRSDRAERRTRSTKESARRYLRF